MKRDRVLGILGAAVCMTAAILPWLTGIGGILDVDRGTKSLSTIDIAIGFLWLPVDTGTGPKSSDVQPSLFWVVFAVFVLVLVATLLPALLRRIGYAIAAVLGGALVGQVYMRLSATLDAAAERFDKQYPVFDHIGVGAYVFVAGLLLLVVAAVLGEGGKKRADGTGKKSKKGTAGKQGVATAGMPQGAPTHAQPSPQYAATQQWQHGQEWGQPYQQQPAEPAWQGQQQPTHAYGWDQGHEYPTQSWDQGQQQGYGWDQTQQQHAGQYPQDQGQSQYPPQNQEWGSPPNQYGQPQPEHQPWGQGQESEQSGQPGHGSPPG